MTSVPRHLTDHLLLSFPGGGMAVDVEFTVNAIK